MQYFSDEILMYTPESKEASKIKLKDELVLNLINR